jgi:hypothetical protein
LRHPKLAEHEPSIEVAPFPCDLVVAIKDEDCADRDFEGAAGRWNAIPRTGVRTTQGQLYEDSFVSDVKALDLETKVGEPPKELPVECADGCSAIMELVVRKKAGFLAEGLHDRVEIVGILDAEVVLDRLFSDRALALTDGHGCRPPVFRYHEVHQAA